MGHGLEAVTELRLVPDEGLALDDLAYDPARQALTARLTVANDAQSGERAVHLFADDVAIPFANPVAGVIRVGPGQPSIESIAPILGGRGDAFELLIRGSRLTGAERVELLPSRGITIGSSIRINGDGTELRIPVAIAADVELGERVVRVHVPGSETAASATAANTFTVYQEVPK
jgi:hypothetical protein